MRLISTRCRAGSKRLPEQQEHCQRTDSRARLYAYGFTGERFSHHRREASPRPVRVFPIGPEGASCRRTWRQAAKGRMVARPARSRSLVRRNTRSASASRTMATVRTVRAVMSCSSIGMTCAAVLPPDKAAARLLAARANFPPRISSAAGDRTKVHCARRLREMQIRGEYNLRERIRL
jgi:hypothetical protein